MLFSQINDIGFSDAQMHKKDLAKDEVSVLTVQRYESVPVSRMKGSRADRGIKTDGRDTSRRVCL